MKNKIGEIKQNNFGTPMKIIAYKNSADIDVEFLDNHHYVKRNATYSNFTKGQIKNPFDKIIQGVGYIGNGCYKIQENKKNTPAYNCWVNMIERCYGAEYQDLHKSYYGISEVCDEWKNFQIFADWYRENEYKVEGRLHLDKDILYSGNKIYSPYHCILVPQRINMLFLNKPNNNGLPNGIIKTGEKYKATYNTQLLGTYESLEDAYQKYAEVKKEKIIQIAEEYKTIIPNKVYQALFDYEVRIENDKNYIK